MIKAGVLVSGGGTNLQAIIDKVKSGYISNMEITVVVSSQQNAYALTRAADNGIASEVCSKKDFSSTEEYDVALVNIFEKYDVDIVIMAGFLSILGEKFVSKYSNKIFNIHPALIPSFCGKGMYGIRPHQAALDYGVKVVGATVHFVNAEPDGGPIILQKAVDVLDSDTPESLQKRVMEQAEWEILPKALKLYCEGKIVVEGRKVIILD